MTDQHTLFGGRLRTSGPEPSDLPTFETEQEGYRRLHRLSVVAALIAGAAAVALLVWLVESAFLDQPRSLIAFLGTGAVLVTTTVVAVGARRRMFSPSAFVHVALTTEVVVSLLLAFPILGWQHRLGADATAWLALGADQPLQLGAGEIPWVGVWIILFATVIPLRPREHLIGALISLSTLFLMPLASTLTMGFPESIEAGRVSYTVHVMVWLTFRGAMATGIAYFAARTVYGLRRSLAMARRMGSYELQERLGAGGMGEVWKADHHMLARSAAIKLIKQPSNETAQAWTELTHRFEREVQTAAQLRSPHTIEIYDYGVNDDGTCYYVMELLDGLDLEELVRTRGPLPWQRVVHLLLQVCHSLGEAHEHGLIHRDIKPANIFLCRIGRDVDRIKVLDFGLVKATMAQTDAGLTQQGMFVGTPAYAAPELATGEAGADHRIDVYSVGCVAFWLLTGQTVFQTGNALEMLMKHARDEPDAPSTRTELEVPPAIDAIVLACLSKEPAARPVSMDDLAARLQRFAADGGWTTQEAKRWWEQHRPRTETTIALASGG